MHGGEGADPGPECIYLQGIEEDSRLVNFKLRETVSSHRLFS